MISFFTLSLLSSVVAQIPKEAFPLTNSMSDLWHKGETQKAVEASLELYRLYPPFLVDNIHNTLAQQVKSDKRQYCIDYLEAMMKNNSADITEIIKPIYLWSKVLSTDNAIELKDISIQIGKLLSSNPKQVSETERYCLLILQELDRKNAIDSDTRKMLVEKNIKSLRKYPHLDEAISSRKENKKRGWYRYLLAYSYNYYYSHIDSVEDYLKLASDYSPDASDRLVLPSYFYDAALLTGNTQMFGFKSDYQKYLAENNRMSEALQLLCEITFGTPTNYHLNALKEFYKTNGNTEDFEAYWMQYINSMGKAVPQLKIPFENNELNLTVKQGKWIYIDVWGTWCSPCRKELPHLQELYQSNNELENSKLEIYSFSYNSKDLSGFMLENKYTFPVSEIDKAINDAFEVSGYPTKILITPEGNYIKIPFGVDWVLFLKNYTLM